MLLNISEKGLKSGYILLSTDKQAVEEKNCKNPGSRYSSDLGYSLIHSQTETTGSNFSLVLLYQPQPHFSFLILSLHWF